MGSAVPKSAAEMMQRLFEVVLDEARTHPEFAEKLLRALPFEAVARIEFNTAEPPRKTPPRKIHVVSVPEETPAAPQKAGAEAFDPNAFSLIADLKSLGEPGLREKLKAFTPKQLQSIVEEQHLDVDDKVFKNKKRATREMIEAIIVALQARIAGRIVAAS